MQGSKELRGEGAGDAEMLPWMSGRLVELDALLRRASSVEQS
jgi:hypothetical protein